MAGPSLLVGALSQGVALLGLFVVLPFVVAGAVIVFVSWRSSRGPAPLRTSEILASGDRAEADVLSVRNLGTVLDVRPMVRLDLRIRMGGSAAPFDRSVTQSVPRAMVRDLEPGAVVEVRVTPDRADAAVVVGALPRRPEAADVRPRRPEAPPT